MSWASVEDLISDLNLKSDPFEIKSIRSEIKEKLTRVHPDTTSGTYESKQSKDLTYKFTEALNFLDDQNNNSKELISISQVSAITKAVSEALNKTKTPSLDEARNSFLTEYKSSQSSKLMMPRVGSGVFGSVCAFLFTFSGQLKEHPILGALTKDPKFYESLSAMIVISGIFFVSTWMLEWMENAKIEQLMSWKNKKEIFGKMLSEIKEHSNFDNEDNSFIKFTINDVSRHVRRRVRQNQAEKIAKLYLQELTERGVIKESKVKSIEPTFEISKQLADELIFNHRF
jgi:hypothetical protein